MSRLIEVPIDLVEAIAQLRLPAKAEARLQHLMDRNNDGELTMAERDALEALVELSELMALIRAQAFRLLGRRPAV